MDGYDDCRGECPRGKGSQAYYAILMRDAYVLYPEDIYEARRALEAEMNALGW